MIQSHNDPDQDNWARKLFYLITVSNKSEWFSSLLRSVCQIPMEILKN